MNAVFSNAEPAIRRCGARAGSVFRLRAGWALQLRAILAGCLNRRHVLPLLILLGLTALVSLLAPEAAAADLQGRVAALNLPKQTIAVRIADHERSFALAKSCQVYQLVGARKDSGYAPVHDGLKAITVGDQVSATTDRIDDREQVIRIKIETPPRKRGRVGHDISGRVAVFDAGRRLISLSETDKDAHYELAKDCNVFQLVGKGSRGRFFPARGGLGDVAVGSEVILNLETQSGRSQVAYIEIVAAAQPKHNK